jgi:hypothetical protein
MRIDRVDIRDAPKVRLYLTELDPQGRVVTTRDEESFTLLVDALPQSAALSVQRFAGSGEPLTLALVMQTSPAMTGVLPHAVEAAKRLVASLPRGSRAGLVAYAEVTHRMTALVDPMKLRGPLDALRIRAEGVELDLTGAVRDALQMLADPKLPGRRVALVFSDGITKKLCFKVFTDLAREAREHGITVLTVGHNVLEPDRLDTLKKLSAGSTGTYRGADRPAEIAAAFEAVQEELANQIIVTYDLRPLCDGKVHDFQIDTGNLSSEPLVTAELPLFEKRSSWGRSWLVARLAELGVTGVEPLFLNRGYQWLLASLAGVGVMGVTMFFALFWRWHAARSRALARQELEREDQDDEDDAEEEPGPQDHGNHAVEAWSGPRHRFRRFPPADQRVRLAPHPRDRRNHCPAHRMPRS